MTNINCSLNCIYQKDGKCSYNTISPCYISSSECVYFVDRKNVTSKSDFLKNN